ncbi:DUF3179 domain-containing protein, partial [Patescibacteria group bacterium]|nr:DUF3179 domain-containing protein [Patescibacteria group bacterium]
MPARKKLIIFLSIFVAVVLVGTGAFVAYKKFGVFLFSAIPEPIEETVEDIPDAEEVLPVEVLAAEKLPQYEGKAEEYDLNEINGSPNKNLFADVQKPKFLTASKETKLEGDRVVASFHVGDDYRAYPLKYIYYHHIVNDRFGDKPVLISYCGICNSAAAYDPVIGGKTLSFGVLGVLLHNDLVMYDRQTDSWWIQITGEAISGKHKGKKLTLLPGMELVEFADFKKAHPNGKVLQPDTQYTEMYNQFGANPEQSTSALGKIATYDQVVGIEVRGRAKAYKLSDVKDAQVINDNLNGWSLLVVVDPKDTGVRVFRRFV